MKYIAQFPPDMPNICTMAKEALDGFALKLIFHMVIKSRRLSIKRVIL
jgi:hypothetical protein